MITVDRGEGVTTVKIVTASLASAAEEDHIVKLDDARWQVGAASAPLLHVFACAPGASADAQLAIDLSPDGVSFTTGVALGTITGDTLVDRSVAVVAPYMRLKLKNTNAGAQVITAWICYPNTNTGG